MSTKTPAIPDGDMIPGRLLADVANNAAFAAIRHEFRKKRLERTLMLLIYPLPWLIGGYYVAAMRGLPPWVCAFAGIHFTLTMLMLLACLFFFGGIEGYEASIMLKPYSLDLWMAGTTPRDLGSAIVAHGSGHYSPRRLRIVAVAIAAVMLGGIASFLTRVESNTIWFAAQGMLPAMIFITCVGRQDVFLIRNALMWIGHVRRNYEKEFQSLGIEGEKRSSRLVRAVRTIALICLMTAVIARMSLFAFDTAGRLLLPNIRPIPLENQAAYAGVAVLLHSVAGIACGWAILCRARSKAAGRFACLSEEMYLLMQYRAELKNER